MRPMIQVVAAGAVLAFAAGAAYAISGSYAEFFNGRVDRHFRANVTHTWKIPGGGNGRTSFSIEGGGCSFGSESADLYTFCSRQRPADGAYASVSFALPRKKATQTRYTAGINTVRLDEMAETAYLSQAQIFLVRPLVDAEALSGPGRYTPIQGNVTTTRVVGNLQGRVYDDFSTYDVSSKMTCWSMISGGPNDGRTVKSTIIIVVRRAPRGSEG